MRGILLALGLAFCSVASATTYYVSTTGNNSNPGTLNAPWATWGHAFNSTAVRPGDTVYFRGGVYQMTSDNLSYPYAAGCGYNVSRDGTLGNYICYFAYPGENPILDCGNITPAGRNSRAILGNDMNYIHFKGLTVRNVKQTSADVNVYGWIIEGNYLKVEGCTVYNCGGRGFFSNGHEIYYLNCDAHHNSDPLSASLPGNDGVGFQNVDLANADGSIYYKNCRAWMNGDQGFSAVSIGYLEFDGCWSFNNGQLQGEGHGFKMGSVGTQETQPLFGPLKRKYINCVAAHNRGNGWTTNEGGGYYGHRMHVYNNTAYHNGYPSSFVEVSYGFFIYNTLSIDTEEITRTYRNNISYNNRHGATFIAASALYTHSNNSWDTGGLTITDTDFISLDSTGITARRRADGSLPDNNCYRNFIKLAPGSDLIDKGVDVGLQFGGIAPDLGAFESSSAIVTPVAPVYISSVIENATSARLELTYNLALASTLPAASAFAVRVNTVTRTVSSVAISGTKVLLTLASPVVYGDVVTVAYTKPATNPLQTTAGGQAVSISAQNVTNNVAAVIPAYVSSVIQNTTPARLVLTYNLALASTLPTASAFAVRVNTVTRTVSSVAISGTTVLLTLASPVVYGDVVTVAYTKPATNPLQTTAGGQAVSISAQNVTNNVAAVIPAYVSSVIENATPARLELTYNLALAGTLPAVTAFTVRVNTVTRTISSVAISSTKVLLTLASPVVYGDVVTVAYTKPATNPLQTTAGGQAVSISAQSVTNRVGNVNQPPVVNISSPIKSTSFIAPATITIDATASDPDGTVVKVEFYQGTVKLGEISSAPYSYTWKEVPEGTYSITAAATDNQNMRTVSAAVSVVVEKSATVINEEPVVVITLPNGRPRKYKKDDQIVLLAQASDPDGSISKVEFKSGDVTLAEVTASPFSYTWQPSDTGTFIITAIATDNLGATSAPSDLELTVGLIYDGNSEFINLYPNPNDGHFVIELSSRLPDNSNRVTIVNLVGKIVYDGTLDKNEYTKWIDISNSPSGNYILVITDSQNIVTTKKFIKN